MAILSLRIADFRNLASTALTPSAAGLNIISGLNGSGKTSLLEAIYYLGLGRSFRSTSVGRLIRHSQDKFSLFAQILQENKCIPLGMERDHLGSSRIRVDQSDLGNIAELAYLLPMRLINSQSHQIFESGPLFRRKYLDWGLFYQDKDTFFTCWRQFERVLKQRNTILRLKRLKSELNPWTEELIKHGLSLNAFRRDYVNELSPIIKQVCEQLVAASGLEITYEPGWPENEPFADVLERSFGADYQQGHTQYGPHRADLRVTVNGALIKQILSRGQQKLLVCAMILAQGILLAKKVKTEIIYLIDDLPSELDASSRNKLVSLLAEQPTQIFITSIESELVSDSIKSSIPFKVFHVKHGQIQEVSN